eukprot:3312513-Amphidinium_carterae.1
MVEHVAYQRCDLSLDWASELYELDCSSEPLLSVLPNIVGVVLASEKQPIWPIKKKGRKTRAHASAVQPLLEVTDLHPSWAVALEPEG